MTTDLTTGNISSKLIKLSLPIILTGFMETTYNLIDMFWVGKLGTTEVAGIGTAGFYLWLAAGFILLARTGAEIKISQKTGEKDEKSAKGYARVGLQLSVIIGLIYSLIMIIFRNPLIGVFQIDDARVVSFATSYLIFVTPAIFFSFINKVATGAFNGRGNSKIPFQVNVIGLIINIILDPVLIFGFGIIPAMGVVGAAIATSMSQFVSMIVFIYHIKIKHSLFNKFQLFKRVEFDKMKEVIKLGTPVCVYNVLFTFIAMVLAVVIARYGAEAIAVQKVGSQIESITWMTALGFATAIGTFTGQNIGAKKYDRVYEGYKESLKIAVFLGVLNTFILFFGSHFLMSLFFENDIIAQNLGSDYLKIMALGQVFMCIEITTTGAFNGLSKTTIPAVSNAIFNLLRIPLALLLSSYMGINGVWYSITISSILKGIVMVVFFYIYLDKNENYKFQFKKLV